MNAESMGKAEGVAEEGVCCGSNEAGARQECSGSRSAVWSFFLTEHVGIFLHVYRYLAQKLAL